MEIWLLYGISLLYSGTCLNRPAKGPGDYGLFIQVVYLDKFEILDQIPITVSNCEEMVSGLIICTKIRTI